MIDIEERIRDVLVRKGRALVERNALKLGELLHPNFVYLNARGKSFDKAGYIDTFCTSASLVFLDQSMIEVAVRPIDDFAVATLVLSDRLVVEGVEQSGRVRSLCVFTKANGEWLWAAGQTMSEG